jgi:hypothetical protein
MYLDSKFSIEMASIASNIICVVSKQGGVLFYQINYDSDK